ncbi:MAG: TolC family protein [Bacteroidales bacterium]
MDVRRTIYLLFLLGNLFTISAQAQVSLSFEESLNLLLENNKSIQIAKKETDIAKSEHQRMNAFWYPNLSASGGYMHMSNKIEVKQSLSSLTNPVKDFIGGILPDDQLIAAILDKIGSYSLTFPLTSQDLTSIDANIVWPVFTGGKRIFASRIGKSLVEVARQNESQVSALSQVALVDTYYALRLGKKVVDVRKETYQALSKQYQDALSLEANGLINKAERLVVQVGMNEAKREYETAQKNYDVAQSAFKSLIPMDESAPIDPVSPLFICDTVPSLLYFQSLLPTNNHLVKQLRIQENIAKYEEKIGKTGYAPNIALIGKQTLYAHGVSKYLLPRTMIGVGFTWNLFDGLDREKKITQARLTARALAIGQEKALDDLSVLVEQSYTNLQIARDNVKALDTTIALSRELLRMREKAYAEGMATSTEVLDAHVGLSKVRVAFLLAYYQFDTALMNLLSTCGIPEDFSSYKNAGKTDGYLFE